MNHVTHQSPTEATLPAKRHYDVVQLTAMGFRLLSVRLSAGSRIYGYYGPRTIRTGPRTFFKSGVRVDESEAEAMQFIANNTSIPVPKVHRVHKYNATTFIEMEFIPGKEAYVWYHMAPPDQRALLEELESYVRQLRSLVPPTPELVASAYGNYCLDHRIELNPAGPFSTHDEFHYFLRMNEDLSGWHPERFAAVVRAHKEKYVSKFAHGDLAPRNVLVHKGRVSAIIDWDCAGWRPEYWEVTKSKYAPLHTPKEWLEAVERGCGSSYELQLEAEIQLWTVAEFPSSPGQVFPCKEDLDALTQADEASC
ncbi:kinase-like domain-containing protein [Mycena belliarum]|uniref:Kinase-like domain-containing protein n=1 Tax=Mycena belliarum TaxID=1033014 RepID=A0AAD6TWC1_9AGAR|nr:kinase-like domain-containing protein [Mycena belliae]